MLGVTQKEVDKEQVVSHRKNAATVKSSSHA
jgi:hypothetical protein